VADVAIDLGHGHTLRFFAWAPNRALNPHLADLSDIARAGAFVDHYTPGGAPCMGGAIFFDTPEVRRVFRDERAFWTASAEGEPLTLTPSLRCRVCGDHGVVRAGRWEPCPS